MTQRQMKTFSKYMQPAHCATGTELTWLVFGDRNSIPGTGGSTKS